MSPQRLTLLNLIQLATMKIEKLNLFSLNHASDILEKINRIEQQQNQKESPIKWGIKAHITQ